MSACVIIVGNLGRDAELQTPSGTSSFLKFSVADTNYRKVTTWFECTLWGKRAEKLAEYLKKGTKVMVRGEISLNKYSTRDGQERTSLDVNVDNVELLGGKPEQPGSTRPDNDIPF